MPLREELEFSFALEDLQARLSPRTKLVILNSPQNPTGGVTPAADLAAAAANISNTPAWVLTDEVYARLIYGDAFASIASVPGMLERTVLLDGFSKAYAMTGWRCGYAAVPETLVEPLTRFFVNSTSCVPPYVQRAASPRDRPAGRCGRDGGGVRHPPRSRRRRLNALPGVPACRRAKRLRLPQRGGGTIGAEQLADRLLEEARWWRSLAGTAFGAHGADDLRLSYATLQANLTRALERMDAFLQAL